MTCMEEGLHYYRECMEWAGAYHAILGSTNGASTMRILIDHKEAPRSSSTYKCRTALNSDIKEG